MQISGESLQKCHLSSLFWKARGKWNCASASDPLVSFKTVLTLAFLDLPSCLARPPKVFPGEEAGLQRHLRLRVQGGSPEKVPRGSDPRDGLGCWQSVSRSGWTAQSVELTASSNLCFVVSGSDWGAETDSAWKELRVPRSAKGVTKRSISKWKHSPSKCRPQMKWQSVPKWTTVCHEEWVDVCETRPMPTCDFVEDVV